MLGGSAGVEAGTLQRPARAWRPGWMQFLRNRVAGVISFVAFIALWHLLIVGLDPNPILFPGPAEVWEEFVIAVRDGEMAAALSDSMYAMFIGLVISLVVGIPLGLAIGMSPTADLLTSPYLWGFFAMPRIALRR